MSKILLASTSPYRKQLLQQMGLSFDSRSPLANEEQLKEQSDLPAREIPLFLAKEKAKSLTQSYPDHSIIGCDQIAVLNDTMLNKPKSTDEAILRLQELSGKTHELVTALAVWNKDTWHTHVETAVMTMYLLSENEIMDYVRLDQPLGCSGAYKIECLGVRLFKSIETKDHHSIIGLPLLALGQILRDLKIFPA